MNIKQLLTLMVEHDASDMFLSVGTDVGIKIDGLTAPVSDTKLHAGHVKALAYTVMTPAQIKLFESELELDFSFDLDKLGRFRINVFQERNEVAMVIRYVKNEIPSIEDLHLPEILKQLIMEPRGLILIVGTSGSGKSTSLASMIDYRNRHKTGHILTIEDPIEYLHAHKKSIVNQREVGLDTHSYATALRRAMRESPDVILIGEIRDTETMIQALRFAQSGHLCLSTLHASNAAEAIKRIINFFPESKYHDGLLMDLSLSIKAIVSQRLLVTRNNKERVPAVEVMLPTPTIKELIEKGQISKIHEAIEQGGAKGMQSMELALFNLYKENKVTLEEVLHNSDSTHNLLLRINMESGESVDHEQILG
jgi:twitching motility protein PilU